MISEQLQKAIQLIQKGKIAPAREILIEELKADPENLDAWHWALEAAANNRERRFVVDRILALDPTHSGALAARGKLVRKKRIGRKMKLRAEDRDDPENPSSAKPVRSGFAGLLKLGLDWALSLPTGSTFLILVLGAALVLFIYTRVNTSLFGLTGADLDNLVISNAYQQVSSPEFTWELDFEGSGKAKYQGSVRHVAPIRIKEFAILTHDILVTSGDYSDPGIVKTNVIDHKFFWKSPNLRSPTGTIHLIHAVPATKEIYQQLLEIRRWDTVLITGREIYAVKAYQSGPGDFIGSWKDTGCNTLLIESVTILTDTP